MSLTGGLRLVEAVLVEQTLQSYYEKNVTIVQSLCPSGSNQTALDICAKHINEEIPRHILKCKNTKRRKTPSSWIINVQLLAVFVCACLCVCACVHVCTCVRLTADILFCYMLIHILFIIYYLFIFIIPPGISPVPYSISAYSGRTEESYGWTGLPHFPSLPIMRASHLIPQWRGSH